MVVYEFMIDFGCCCLFIVCIKISNFIRYFSCKVFINFIENNYCIVCYIFIIIVIDVFYNSCCIIILNSEMCICFFVYIGIIISCIVKCYIFDNCGIMWFNRCFSIWINN